MLLLFHKPSWPAFWKRDLWNNRENKKHQQLQSITTTGGNNNNGEKKRWCRCIYWRISNDDHITIITSLTYNQTINRLIINSKSIPLNGNLKERWQWRGSLFEKKKRKSNFFLSLAATIKKHQIFFIFFKHCKRW
jgi:hypothetical protein